MRRCFGSNFVCVQACPVQTASCCSRLWFNLNLGSSRARGVIRVSNTWRAESLHAVGRSEQLRFGCLYLYEIYRLIKYNFKIRDLRALAQGVAKARYLATEEGF